jgi:hypothetical protein
MTKPAVPSQAQVETLAAVSAPVKALGQLRDAGVPMLTLGGSEIPLFAGAGSDVWALLNLILCIIGVLLAIVTILRLINNRRYDRDEESLVYQDEDGDKKRQKPVWVTMAIILSIAGAAVFILTQDMSSLMVLTDTWTILNAAILIVETAAIRLASVGMPSRDDCAAA